MHDSQFNHDMAEPENFDGQDMWVYAQAGQLLAKRDADNIPWPEFAQVASENVADADGDSYPLLQILLAVRNKNMDAAYKLYVEHFDTVICEAAEAMVKDRMGKV